MPSCRCGRSTAARMRAPRWPVNPTLGVSLPAVRGRRERIARPEEAAQLIAALTEADRALWATALYSGLRAGRTPGAALGGRRLRGRTHPRRAQLGPRRGAGRAEEPGGPATRAAVHLPAQAHGRPPPPPGTGRRGPLL